ncbi:MAG: response regulator [Vicinamibacteria bacterium]|nr:response regulator [Vicinamibacteria bacterium]
MSDTRGKRVLVVDDEEDVRVLLVAVMRGAGYEVAEAENGTAALERLQTKPFDLILLDVMMPGLDGWGVLDRLKELPDAPPVVLATARNDEETFQRGVKAGVAALVGKPFAFQDLLAACERALQAPHPPREEPERRRLPRRELMVKVRVLSQDSAPLALGELVNLSKGGAQVNLLVPLELGTRIRVGLHVSASTHNFLKFEGTVQWRESEPLGYAHGLAFTDLEPEVANELRALFEGAA